MSRRNGFKWDTQNSRLSIQVAGVDVAHFPGHGSYYTPHGSAFYVDRVNGSDDNSGLSPELAVAKIDTAVGLCTADADDYIFVISKGEGTYVEGATITFDIARVHCIGIGNSNMHPYCQLKAASAFNVFTVTGRYGEIANFRISGGSTTCGGVYVNNATGTWIHHNDFGNKDAGTTPGYGILGGASQINAYCVYEDNMFSGSGGTGSVGAISVTGIHETGAFRAGIIQRNYFVELPTRGITLSGANGAFILDNMFMLDEDTAGAAINLNGSACFISGNVASDDKADVTANPYVNTGTNAWCANYLGKTLTQPS